MMEEVSIMKETWLKRTHVMGQLFLILLLAAANTCKAQVQEKDINADRMDDVVRQFALGGLFMGSVLVARGDEILFHKSYGSANLEWDIPNTTLTRFRIGSLTKQFTAAAILLLEEQGKLSVDDPVKKYMPDAPEAWEKITLFHLLTHTAGLPNFQVPLNEETTVEKTVLSFRDMPLRFHPGDKYDYKNSGYQLLAYLIEKISGQSYEQFLKQNIFAPLEMNDTGLDRNPLVIPHRAEGYTNITGGEIYHAGFIDMSVPYSAGGLYSTTGDLYRWYRGLFGGKLLSAESLGKMTTPFKEGYAFGLQVFEALGRKTITHSGEINGFASRLTYFPETDITLAVLANMNPAATDPIAGMLNQLAHGENVQLASDLQEATVAPDLLARYVGVYEDPQGRAPVTTIALEEDRLVFIYEQRWDANQIKKMRMQGKRPPESGVAEISIPLFPSSENLFFLKTGNIQMEFILDKSNKATGVVVNQNGQKITLKRSDDSSIGGRKPLSSSSSVRTGLSTADKKMLTGSWSGMLKGPGG
ncbi:MAG: serine hydrolase, partial [Acidobacteriota bacterium]